MILYKKYKQGGESGNIKYSTKEGHTVESEPKTLRDEDGMYFSTGTISSLLNEYATGAYDTTRPAGDVVTKDTSPMLTRLYRAFDMAFQSTDKLSSEPITLDLNQGDYAYSRNGEFVEGKMLLGGNFVHDDHKQLSAFPAKKYKGAKSNSDVYYGISNGKFKVGEISLFGDDDMVARSPKGYHGQVTQGDHSVYGRIVVFSRSTGAKEFIYGNGHYTEDAMNAFQKANPDAEYLLMDNGRYRKYVNNPGGLVPEDYMQYSGQDSERSPGAGFNIIKR